MKINWFKQQHRYGVCKECGVHFEPRDDAYPNLCLEHMRPIAERDTKRDCVTQWARENWEKLYEQYEKDRAARMAAYNAMNQAGMSSMAAAQQAAQQAAQGNDIFGLTGFGIG